MQVVLRFSADFQAESACFCAENHRSSAGTDERMVNG